MRFLLVSLIAVGIAASSGASGTAGVVFPASVFATPPTIDGVINAEEWLPALTDEGAVDLETGAPAPEGMRFWLGHDAQFVYFAARLEDSQPNTIIATETRQNVSLDGNDRITLFLDTSGSYVEGNNFLMNPNGATSILIAGGRAAKTEWLGEIQSKGRITDTGWEVEARIPWKIMRLPEPGKRTVLFNVMRYMPRTQRRYIWRYLEGGNATNMGKWEGVEIPKQSNERTLKLLPYGYLGGGDQKPIFNAGVDMRTQVSDRLEAVGSLNPDFRNIERQVLSLDFSYFERLADDSRPFFQEGGRFFNFGFGTRIFASQRVPAFDTGFKVFGKPTDESQFGVMNLTTFQKQNALVASYQNVPNPNFSYGAAIASLRSDTRSNDAYLANVSRQFGPTLVYLINQGTFDQDLGKGQMLSAGFFGNQKGRNYFLDYTQADSRFNPRLGFSQERDFRSLTYGEEWTKTHPRGRVMEHEIGFHMDYGWRYNGDPYRRGANVSLSLTDRSGLDLDLGARIGRFEQNDDERYAVSIEKPRGDRYRNWEVGYVWGRLQGIRYQQFGVNSRYRPLPNLQLSLTGQWVSHTSDRRQVITSANWDLSKDESISGRAIYSGNDWNAYLSYRKSGGYGAEYFVILGDPNADSFRSSLIVKAVFPMEIRY